MNEAELTNLGAAALMSAAGEFEKRCGVLKLLINDLQHSIEALSAKQTNDEILEICYSLAAGGKSLQHELASQRLEIAELEYKWDFLSREVLGNA